MNGKIVRRLTAFCLSAALLTVSGLPVAGEGGSGTAVGPITEFVLDDSDAVYTGAWTLNEGELAEQRYGSGFRYVYYGEPSTATYTAKVEQEGWYEVSAWWTTHENRAKNAPFTITAGDGEPVIVRVNQEEKGGRWNRLQSVYAKAGDTLTVVLGNDAADDWVVADALKIALEDTADSVVMEESEAEYIGDGWTVETSSSQTDRHGSAFRYADGGIAPGEAPNHTAAYRYTADEPGLYEVYAWWPALDNRPAAVPYTISCGERTETVRVNQRERSACWNLLGYADAQVGQEISVTVSNDAGGGWMVVDAVKFHHVDALPTFSVALDYDAEGGSVIGWTTDIPLSEEITLTAVPEEGYTFQGWYSQDRLVCSTADYTFTVREDIALSPRFVKKVMENGIVVDNTEAELAYTSQANEWVTQSSEGEPECYGENFSYVGGWIQAGETPSHTAAYTFTAPEAGVYNVYSWWVAGTNRATDAPYTIISGEQKETVRVNQQERGGRWNLLGQVTVQEGQELQVVLSNDADQGYVIADAVGMEKVGEIPPPLPEETEFIFDDTDAQYTGNWTLEEADKLDQRFGTGFRYAAGWEQANTAVYTAVVGHTGWYEISAWWTDLFNRATDAPFTVACGEQEIRVTVNQQEKGGRWNQIQTVWAEAGNTITVTLGGGGSAGNNYIVADGLKISLAEGLIVDDSQAELTGTWSENVTDNLTERFGPKFRFADPTGEQTPTATAAFRAQAPQAGIYNVYAWWTTHDNRAQNVPYTLADGRVVRVDQERDGGRWNLLGKITADAGDELSAVLGNNADQYVVADAVKFQLDDGILEEDEAVLEGSTWILETGDKAEERHGDAFYYSGWVGQESEPTATATYRTIAAEDGYYAVYGWWTTHDNRSAITPYTICWGGQTQSVRVNQRENGGMWNQLGLIQVTAGQEITITVGNNADGYVIADAIRIEKTDAPPADTYNITLQYDKQGGFVTGKTVGIEKGESVTLTAEPRGGWDLEGWYLDGKKKGEDLTFTLAVEKNVTVEARFQKITTPDGIIVDDTDALFTGDWTMETGDCLDQRYGDGFRYKVWNGAANQPDSTASFTITAQEAGYYEIYAWWTTNANRATDAPYTILAGGGRQTMRVNQRENGGFWNRLGGVTAAAGQDITVVLGNNSDNGYVIADAVKFVKTDAPETYSVKVLCDQKRGSVSGKTAGIVAGEEITLTAAPKSGWDFDGWYRDGSKISDALDLLLTVKENITLEARFAEEQPEGPGKSGLEAAIADARTSKTDGRYADALPSAQKELDRALDAAVMVYNNPAASETAIEKARAELAAAIEKLDVHAGDKTELTWVTAYADGLELSRFQEEGKADFQKALKAAHAMLENEEALQLDVDKTLQELVHALSVLRYKAS